MTGRFFYDRAELPCEFRDMAVEEQLWAICQGFTDFAPSPKAPRADGASSTTSNRRAFDAVSTAWRRRSRVRGLRISARCLRHSLDGCTFERPRTCSQRLPYNRPLLARLAPQLGAQFTTCRWKAASNADRASRAKRACCSSRLPWRPWRWGCSAACARSSPSPGRRRISSAAARPAARPSRHRRAEHRPGAARRAHQAVADDDHAAWRRGAAGAPPPRCGCGTTWPSRSCPRVARCRTRAQRWSPRTARLASPSSA